MLRERFPVFTQKGGLFHPAACLHGASVTLSQAIALLGVSATRPFVELFAGILDDAVVEIEPTETNSDIVEGIFVVHGSLLR